MNDPAMPSSQESALWRAVKGGLLRAIIPAAIIWGMALALQLTGEPADATSTFLVGVIVAAVAGFSVLYDIESWSVLKASLVHTGCMAVIACRVWSSVDGSRPMAPWMYSRFWDTSP